jgi:hypothetical protein
VQIGQPEFVRTKHLRVFPDKQHAPEGVRGVGPPAASLSSHVVAFPFLTCVGSVFVPDVLPFAFATKSGIGWHGRNGFGLGGGTWVASHPGSRLRAQRSAPGVLTAFAVRR